MLKRCMYIAPVAFSLYPRKAYASHTHTPKSTYRQRFEQLNHEDNQLVISNYRAELSKEFGYSHVIANLDKSIIDELHYILVLYSKPLSPERRIMIRNKFLPFLESSDDETIKFFEHVLSYYGVL